MDVDGALQRLGRWGRWQTTFYLLLCVTATFPAVWHMLAIVFLGGIPTHTCKTEDRNRTIPRLTGSKETLAKNDGFERCHYYVNKSTSNVTRECDNDWTYWDSEGIGPTIVSEFDLVCDHEALTNTAQTIMVCGVLVGAMLFTFLSDNFGRKPVFLFSQWAMVVVGVATAFTSSYTSFAVLRFFAGMFQQGILLTGFIMACELFPANQRTFAGLAIELFWATGMCLEALLGYLIRNWRHLQLVLSLPWILTIALYWVLPESVPWLCANNRVHDAELVLKKAAKMNKVEMPENILEHGDVSMQETTTTSTNEKRSSTDGQTIHDQSDERSKQNGGEAGVIGRLRGRFRSIKMGGAKASAHDVTIHRYTLLDVLKNRKLRVWALIMCLLWFVNTLVYYGLSLSTSELAGDRYLNFFLSALVEVPAYGSSIFILERWGRRYPLAFYHILAGVALIVMIGISHTPNTHGLLLALSMIGKFGITSSFGTVFLYAPEIFPTTLRSQAMGISSVGGRLGNVLAPFSALVARKVYWLPGSVFGILSIVVGLLALLLPETLNRPLPQTIEDIENWSRDPPAANRVEEGDKKHATPPGSDVECHSNDMPTKTGQ